jgi:type II secretory ATPase GspE/PulE/Tfp pilus assembly ATPase PilB-like protein
MNPNGESDGASWDGKTGMPLLKFNEALRYRAIVVRVDARTATLVSCRPRETYADYVGTSLRREVEHIDISEADFNDLLARTYPGDTGTFTPGGAEDEAAADAPARQELLKLFERAFDLHVTDVHFEWSLDGTARIRMRQDRMLLDKLTTHPTQTRMAAFLRVLRHEAKAKSDPLASPGARLTLPSGRTMDIRLQFLPAVRGEEAAVRVIGTGVREYKLGELGMPRTIFKTYDLLLSQRVGAHILIGPVNAGKSTTMRAVGGHLEDKVREVLRGRAGAKIVSIEAPVEVQRDYSQVEVDEEARVSYNTIVSKLVRSDYDLAIIGEINDPKTAAVFFDAALAGRMLISSYHANDTISAILRLISMGVAASTLQAALKSVLYQRLLPALCPECKDPMLVTADLKGLMQRVFEEAPGEIAQPGHKPNCQKCQGVGTLGLLAIFEILPIAGNTRTVLTDPNLSYDLLRDAAVEDTRNNNAGYMPIDYFALDAVRKGLVSWAAAQEVCALQ